ncbi:MAG: aminotransferase class V-fold PLP-dependent enzyme, partial [Gemmatimonadales bacterium]
SPQATLAELDHHGNVAPWQAVARERGLLLRWLPLDPASGELRLEQLSDIIGPRTRLLAIGAASNLLGTMPDVTAAARMARAAGALVFVDGVHYAPHSLPDVAALGADFFACSAYKFYGPHVGVLWCRREIGAALDVPRLDPAPDTMPERLETGTQNHEGIVGAAAALDWLASLSGGGPLRAALELTYRELHCRSGELFAELHHGLAAIEGVQVFGPPAGGRRTPTLSFALRGHDPAAIAAALAADGLFVSHGDFYAATAVNRIGHAGDGVVRIGLACYSTRDEVDRVIDAVARIAAGATAAAPRP